MEQIRLFCGMIFLKNECVDLINEWSKAAKKINNDIIVLCHGGPISTPSDVEYIFKNCPLVNGFYGASSMERLPVEEAIKQQTMFFKKIKLN